MQRCASSILLCFFLTLACSPAAAQNVLPGIDVLRERAFDILKGKRVGLVTNPTGVDSRLQSTIDILAHAPGVTLVALYGPEHGVRGDAAAGATVESTVDPTTGVPVFSLYGRDRKPSPRMLKGVDVLLYDIQDIGVRSYTYISTLGLCMEAAAEQGIPFVVLDRPDPLGGLRVEGTPVHSGFESFVSPYPIPYVYGLTPGELAGYLNDTRTRAAGKACSLIVVPLRGWHRSMTFRETGLHWVPTSPHVPDWDGAMYYVATGVLGELGNISAGVGFTLPFHLVGAPWIDEQKMADAANALRLGGVLFRPMTFRPFYGRDSGKELHGVQIYITDREHAELLPIQFHLLEILHGLYPEKDLIPPDAPRLQMFDRVLGTDDIRKAFCARYKFNDIRALLSTGVQEFSKLSRKYWLYD
jgi:uncharacterized protein YbbC (DUF1343 family)